MVSRAADLTMPRVSTSSTSRVPFSRGVAEEGWLCASMPVCGDFIEVHTGSVNFFSQRTGAKSIPRTEIEHRIARIGLSQRGQSQRLKENGDSNDSDWLLSTFTFGCPLGRIVPVHAHGRIGGRPSVVDPGACRPGGNFLVDGRHVIQEGATGITVLAALSGAGLFQLRVAISAVCLCGSNYLCIAAFNLECNRLDVGCGHRRGLA